MLKIAIGFLLNSSFVHARTRPASFLPFRSLATGEIEHTFANTVNGEVGTSSTGASNTRKVLEKKKAPRLKTGKSGSSVQGSRGAESSLPPQISTVKAKSRAKLKITADVYAEDLGACVVATKKATELTEICIPGAENAVVYECTAVGKREELASCANVHSVQEELTEIIAKLDLGTHRNGNRWEEAARKLLGYGISLAHITVMLKKCKTLHCSAHWVDSTVKHCAQLGMSHQQMGRVFSKWPTILNVNDNVFKCKIEFFESIGIDRQTLGKFLNLMVMAITMSLPNLRQKCAFWESYMKGVRTNAFSIMIARNPELLAFKFPKQKLAWLETQKYDKKWLVTQPLILRSSLPLLISKARVLECFGISDARKRVWVLIFVSSISIPRLQARFECLLTAGFSRNQAQDIIVKSPIVLGCTEDNINLRINYLFNVMNASFDAILSSPGVWTHNFETRIKYRHEVIKRLQSLGLLKHGVSLGYMVCMTNADFNRKFVERFEDVVKQADALSA